MQVQVPDESDYVSLRTNALGKAWIYLGIYNSRVDYTF